MASEPKVTLPGSERKAPLGTAIGDIDPKDKIEVSIFMRRTGSAPPVSAQAGMLSPISHEQFAGMHGADPDDIARIEQFAHESELTVVESSAKKRRVILSGTAGQMMKAFGADLKCYQTDDKQPGFRARTGSLTIPADIQPMIMAILGLDSRPVAKPHFMKKKKAHPAAPAGTFTPPQVAKMYNFPTNLTGAGQTIAIIELGGGYKTSDLKTYFQGIGVKEPSITAVSVDKGTNSPGGQADGEVMLDIEIAGSIAPGAKIAVYFTPNTDQGFIDAITDAAHDTTRKPSVISISWGGPEDSWTPQSQTAMNAALQDAAALGVTVTVAAGDNGSDDGVGDGNLHVDFPASSPYALACGGTKLAGSGTSISSEVVWNETANQEGATGGGVSNVFPIPSYQNNAGVPKQPQTGHVGRGVPDVAGDADPSTGYQIRYDGQDTVVGGTSAVAPLWAALIALVNQHAGTRVGFINPKLYAAKEQGFHDITSGSNDYAGLGYYSAKSGWDPCTGLGSPDGNAILQLLTSGSASKASA